MSTMSQAQMASIYNATVRNAPKAKSSYTVLHITMHNDAARHEVIRALVRNSVAEDTLEALVATVPYGYNDI